MRIFFILSLLILSSFIFAQNVTNVSVRQEGKNIVITYYLDKEANITLQYKAAGSYGYPQHVYGDVGVNVQPGLKTITWKVLLDHEKFIYNNVQFFVSASKSSNEQERDQKQLVRHQKYSDRYPFAGMDLSFGYSGTVAMSLTGYIPISKHITSLVLDFYYGFDPLYEDKKNYSSLFLACNVGFNFMVHESVGVFAAPGFGLRDYYSNGQWKINKPCFSFHTGVGVSFNWFLLTAHVAYPLYVGAGIGFTL